MGASAINTPAELWESVAAIRDCLREAGEVAAARRLHDAMTISSLPGEVWPETRMTLLALLEDRPDGFDEAVAHACIDYLGTWP